MMVTMIIIKINDGDGDDDDADDAVVEDDGE